MRSYAFSAACILTLALPSAFAADTTTHRILDAKPGLHVLFDDDGGRVEITTAAAETRHLENHGGEVLTDPRINAVFVGDWSSHKTLQAKILTSLQSFGSSEPFLATRGRGVRTDSLLVTAIDLPSSVKEVSDLGVQSLLNDGLSSGRIPDQGNQVIYILILAPEIKSHLADAFPGKDYLSYHSQIHLDTTHAHYVVFPASVKLSTGELLNSTLQTILNPNGDGWY